MNVYLSPLPQSLPPGREAKLHLPGLGFVYNQVRFIFIDYFSLIRVHSC